MGWFFTHGASRKDIIEYLSRPHRSDLSTHSTVARYFRGNTMYAVHEIKAHDGSKMERYACVYLLQRDKDGWGYKPLEETCGPYYCDMPGKHLDMLTPTDHQWANEWRATCRKRIAARKAKRRKPDVKTYDAGEGCKAIIITP